MGGSIRAFAGGAAILLAALVGGCGNVTVAADVDGAAPAPAARGADVGRPDAGSGGAGPPPCSAHDGCHQGKAKPCPVAGGGDCDSAK